MAGLLPLTAASLLPIVATSPITATSSQKVQVQTSTIPNAGRGVFATLKIKKGEFVCFAEGYEWKQSSVSAKMTPLEHTYHMGSGLVGFVKPKSQLGIGQIINDRATIDWSSFKESSSAQDQFQFIHKRISDYIKTANNCNVISHSLLQRKTTATLEFTATRDIEAGEELFFHYGRAYWQREILGTCSMKCWIAIMSWNSCRDAALLDCQDYMGPKGKELASSIVDASRLVYSMEELISTLLVPLHYLSHGHVWDKMDIKEVEQARNSGQRFGLTNTQQPPMHMHMLEHAFEQFHFVKK